MRLSILIFDGVTVLDAVGGYEVLARVPGIEVEFVARDAGDHAGGSLATAPQLVVRAPFSGSYGVIPPSDGGR